MFDIQMAPMSLCRTKYGPGIYRKSSSSPWLAAKIGDDGAKLHIHIGHFIEQFTERCEIAAQPAKVCGDEGCVWMFLKHAVLLFNDRVPRGGVGIASLAIGMRGDFKPAFVVFIFGEPKGFGSAECISTGILARRIYPIPGRGGDRPQQ